MSNISDRSRWYLEVEVQAGFIALALSSLGVTALAMSFLQAQNENEPAALWLTLRVSPALAVLLITVPLGFLYGRLSLSTRLETELSFAEALRLLNDVSMRQVLSGNSDHVNHLASLSRDAEMARQTAVVVLDKIWRIRDQLDSDSLRRQLAVAMGARRLLARFACGEEPPTVGRETTIEFRIEPFQDDEAGPTAVAEGMRSEEKLLRIYIVSNQIVVKDAPPLLSLPDVGSSSAARAIIVPKTEGTCELTFILLADETLELLQTYTTTIDVVPPDAEGV